MNELSFASIRTLQKKVESKEIQPAELLSFYRERFLQHNKNLDAALQIFDLESITERMQPGTLNGIPGLIKDNICQQGRNASCASKILERYNAPYDATVIQRLKKAGAPILGRANMDEFAMGSSGETSAFQLTKNPWDTSRVPGGSSSGSAAAVAAGLVPWALGTETGGSVRQPAAFCGIVGLKPTYGLVSRYGLIAYASSLDQIGVLTREVYDNALILSVMAGKDVHDSSSLPVEPQDYTKHLTGKLKEGFTLGVIDNALEAQGFNEEVYAALNEALRTFEKLGARIKRLTLPMMDHGAATYFLVSRAEAASNLARFDGVRYGHRSKKSETLNEMYTNTRGEGFGFLVKSRILIGNYALSVGHADQFYNSAKIVQGLMRDELNKAFKEVDLLFGPVTPIAAFKFGEIGLESIEMDLQDYFTSPSNLTGTPALSVPCGFTKSMLPIGFQLMGPDLSEGQLFQAAYAYEQATPWHTMHPQNYK